MGILADLYEMVESGKEGKDMKSERVKKAQRAVLDRGIDYVMEAREASDFVEVVGSIGGDVVTYRVYDDGKVYQR